MAFFLYLLFTDCDFLFDLLTEHIYSLKGLRKKWSGKGKKYEARFEDVQEIKRRERGPFHSRYKWLGGEWMSGIDIVLKNGRILTVGRLASYCSQKELVALLCSVLRIPPNKRGLKWYM